MQEYVKSPRSGRRSFIGCVITISAIAVLSPLVFADDDTDIEFVPRTSAPPARRVGAGTRGPEDRKPLRAVALAPKQTLGYTMSNAPVVYFSLSRATDKPIEVAVNDLGHAENPIFEWHLPKGHAAGLLKVDLSTMKDDAGKPIKLMEGAKYEVVLASEENPNDNAVTQISRMKADDGLPNKDRFAASAAWYAKHGIWFDAIDALNRGIEKKPDDAKLLKLRKKLLVGQGLIQADDGSIREETSPGK